MNEILVKKMRLRRLKTRIKETVNLILALALICSASLFAISFFSYADEDAKKENVSEEYDLLLITPYVYLEDETLNNFEMKTNTLKIKTEKDIKIDVAETQYIFQYCIFNEVEKLDLSEAEFLDNEFKPAMFVYCRTMKEVILPDSIETIGKYAFYGWKGLEKINMPKALVEIEEGAFSGCMNLEPVTFGPNIKRLGEQAFLGCMRNSKIELPNTIEYIGKFCFADSPSLKEIVLPNNENLEIDGLIVENKNVVLSVYVGSKAYDELVPFSETGALYKCNNKILIKPVVTRNNLKKNPKVKEIKNEMNIGFSEKIENFINVDITDTGAISYKLELKDSVNLKELKVGTNEVNYKITYYLADVDVSTIKTKTQKVDNLEEVLEIDLSRNDTRFFVLATKYEDNKSIKIKVNDFTSKESKLVKEATEKYSKLLNVSKHSSYMSGFKDGTFRPNEYVTNGEVAAIIARLKNFDDTKDYNFSYSDVKKTSWLSKYVGYVTEKGIMTGTNGMFRPNENITRGEFIVAIAKLLNLNPISEKSQYPDVWNKPNEEYIVAFEKLGIVNGLPNGSFGYSKNITRAEVAKIINSAFDRNIDSGKLNDDIKELVKYSDVTEKNWFYKDVIEASIGHYEHEFH